uniref:Uncharacterized protein n=1 Tax=Avena sativa TaxID=4498 RepID=A0ACD6A7N5_AVESA
MQCKMQLIITTGTNLYSSSFAVVLHSKLIYLQDPNLPFYIGRVSAHPHLQFTMPLLIVFTLLLFLRIPPASDATTDTIMAGQALAVNNKLVSKNGRYALGFFETRGTTNWYLGIWFNTVPKFTTAWVANRDKPIKTTTSLELIISHDGNLVIQNSSTKSIIWSTHAKITRNNTTATLLSSGNFILANSSNSIEVLWQSFDHPTDTFFLGQNLDWTRLPA